MAPPGVGSLIKCNALQNHVNNLSNVKRIYTYYLILLFNTLPALDILDSHTMTPAQYNEHTVFLCLSVLRMLFCTLEDIYQCRLEEQTLIAHPYSNCTSDDQLSEIS